MYELQMPSRAEFKLLVVKIRSKRCRGLLSFLKYLNFTFDLFMAKCKRQ